MHISLYLQDGDTALHNACTNGHTDTVEALIAAGIDQSLTNKVSRELYISA